MVRALKWRRGGEGRDRARCSNGKGHGQEARGSGMRNGQECDEKRTASSRWKMCTRRDASRWKICTRRDATRKTEGCARSAVYWGPADSPPSIAEIASAFSAPTLLSI